MKIKLQTVKTFALVLFCFLSIYNNASWGASFSYVMIPFLLFMLVAMISKTPVKTNTLSIFIIYILYFISTIFSRYVEFGREFFSFALFCVFFIVVASFEYTLDDLKKFILSYIFISFTVCSNICYQWATEHYTQVWLRRSSFFIMGHFKDPNYVLAFVSPAAILSIMLFYYSKRKKTKVLMLINLVITFLACMASGSRAGMLAIGLSVILMILFSKQITVKTKIGILLGLGIVIIAGISFMLHFYNQYALDRMFNDTEGGGRLTIWRSALEVVKSNPLIGGGLNAGSAVSYSETGYTTHSIFIDIICDSGIVGLISMVIFVLKNCILTARNNMEFQLILGCSCIVPMFFINGFNTTTFYFPLIILAIFRNYLENHNFRELVSI